MEGMKESSKQKAQKSQSKPRLVGVNKKLAWIYRNDLVASLELVVSHVRGQRKMDANWMKHARSQHQTTFLAYASMKI